MTVADLIEAIRKCTNKFKVTIIPGTCVIVKVPRGHMPFVSAILSDIRPAGRPFFVQKLTWWETIWCWGGEIEDFTHDEEFLQVE